MQFVIQYLIKMNANSLNIELNFSSTHGCHLEDWLPIPLYLSVLSITHITKT